MVWSLASIALLAVSLGYVALRPDSKCKVMPSDAAWPAEHIWDKFNASVDGRLIKTVPIGQPCHAPTFSEDACDAVQKNWNLAAYHLPFAGDIMYPNWLNKSCDPFTAPDSQCLVGHYVEYSVDIGKPEHIATTAKFAKKNNIRLVVKNTGHDLQGRSTGAGALSVWTHNLKDASLLDYESDGYTGKAVKAGAGSNGLELQTIANKEGYLAVGGQSATVGFTGGYIQGGGHSFLSSKHGLAADQVLEWEVVTTEGDLITASPTENHDLYWALAGGGPGTYGIVYSVTVKLYKDVSFATASISISSDGIDTDTFFKATSAYFATVPNITDAGGYAVSILTDKFLAIPLLALSDTTIEELNALTAPFLKVFDDNGVTYTYTTASFDTYLDMWTAFLPVYDIPVGLIQMGGRLMPASLWKDDSSFAGLMDTFRELIDSGAQLFQFAIAPTVEASGNADNAVLPAWRESLLMVNTVSNIEPTTSMEVINQNWDTITNVFDPLLKEITPGGGAYGNEANPFEPDWKNAFYGSNYEKLLKIKDKYDPSGLLFGRINVGNDRWVEREDGRLCRA